MLSRWPASEYNGSCSRRGQEPRQIQGRGSVIPSRAGNYTLRCTTDKAHCRFAQTPYNSSRDALPCYGGESSASLPRVQRLGTTQGGTLTMKNDLKAFLLAVGGLLAVAGSGLLVLWAVLS